MTDERSPVVVTTTLVLRVPTERAEEAMLALALKGFGDVLAYESDHAM